MTTTLERRFTRGTLEYRAASDGTAGNMFGYANKFNLESQNLGGFVERTLPTTFNKSLGDNLDVLARYNHDDAALLGRTASGTLTLSVDEIGLAYDVSLPDTTVGRDVAALTRRGDIYQSSFAFYTIEDDWGVTANGFPLRTLTSIRLVDVAPVNMPAYLDATAGMRSLAERVHIDADEIPSVPTEEIRRRLESPTVIDLASTQTVGSAEESQRDTHGSLTLARLRLDLLARRTN